MKNLKRIKSILKKPPSYIAARIYSELRHELDRFSQPRFGKNFNTDRFLSRTGDLVVTSCWERLANRKRPFYFPDKKLSVAPNVINLERILANADRASKHEIDLMGSGLVSLGKEINWLKDYKSGDEWSLAYFRSIDYINRYRVSDVKTVWELSRLQWLIPCGQAYILTGEEKYAITAKKVLESWIHANPYAMSVNWGVTMEPAMRIFTCIWLFYAFSRSKAWSDPSFQEIFLRSIYLHAVFTERFIERSDINGNHFTADAAALVAAGSFFGQGDDSDRWLKSGLKDLEIEIIRQVGDDGVDFEGSVAYHRLVAELFLVAAAFAKSAGYTTSPQYLERLKLMGHFSAAYSRSDGTSPLLGDADDARTLPFGSETIIDHRYLPGLIGLFLDDNELIQSISAPAEEAWWWFGPDLARKIPNKCGLSELTPRSTFFEHSGYYIFRDKRVHAFIDCAEVGLSGRGGHGHNDVLSFELAIDGVLIVSDAGSYVYTGDFNARNRFRSGSVHNTPMISDQEQNRFYEPEFLWTLQYDAKPCVRTIMRNSDIETIELSHSGYERLTPALTPVRKFKLLRETGKFFVEDSFECDGSNHNVRVPLQLAPGITVGEVLKNRVELKHDNKNFFINWQSEGLWKLEITQGLVSKSYGRCVEAPQLNWYCDNTNHKLMMEFGVSVDV